jgi:hypothetical protein
MVASVPSKTPPRDLGAPGFERYTRAVDRGRAGFEGGGRVVPLVFHEVFTPAEDLSDEERRELAIKQAAIRIVAGLETRSLRALAREIGCGHTAIDNRVDRLCKALGLRKFMVSEETRARLRAARVRRVVVVEGDE